MTARSLAGRASVRIAVLGVLVSGALAWAGSEAHDRNESRLLAQRTSEVGAVLQTATAVIQTPLASLAELAEATDGDAATFAHLANGFVGGPSASFVSLSLWTMGATEPTTVVGAAPNLATRPASEVAAVLDHAAAIDLMTVLGRVAGPEARLGYAYTSLVVRPIRFVAYGEATAPPERAAAVPSGNAFAGLDYALFLGGEDPAHLLTSTVDLPVGHPRAVQAIALGDQQLTIVTTPHGELGGTLMTWLPWITGAAGLAFTATVAWLAERLTRRRDEQRDIAQTLQRSLLPSRLPDLAGVELAARYQPGARGVDVGGDWYDVLPDDDGTVLVVVGDVSGRGLQAATTMAALRFATKAYAVESHPPGKILDLLGELLDVTRDGRFATTVCVRLDLERRVATIANAGHPPPILVDEGGARFLEAPVGPPIGVPAGGPRRSVEVALPARGTLLAFTDGLFERRGEVIDAGLGRVLDAARGAQRLPLDGLIAAVVDGASAGSDDDTVIVGFRWGPQVPSSSGPTSAPMARSPSR